MILVILQTVAKKKSLEKVVHLICLIVDKCADKFSQIWFIVTIAEIIKKKALDRKPPSNKNMSVKIFLAFAKKLISAWIATSFIYER